MGSTEADIVKKLHSKPAYTLSLVATEGIQGYRTHLFNPVTFELIDTSFVTLGLGPMAILLSHQRKGLCSQLIFTGLQACQRLDYELVAVLGHLDYYPCFGFVPASRCNIKCEYNAPDEPFVVLDPHPRALSGQSAIVNYQPELNEG